MHALLVTYGGYFGEEETWNLREIKSKSIGHILEIDCPRLKE
jgi:hypothetical protein